MSETDKDLLTAAIEAGDLAATKQHLALQPERLRSPASPEQDKNYRPMNVAAVNGQTEILAYLIAEGGDVMDCGNFPLCRAATRGGAAPAMGLLIDHGADVNRVCQDYGPALIYAIEGGSQDSVQLLLERGAVIAGSGPGSDGAITWDGLKHAGIFSRDNEWMLPLLLEHGADVNSPVIDQRGGKDHNTALHNVAAKGDLKGVKLLLQHGADRDAVNNKDRKPIDVARSKAVKALLHGP